MKKLNLLSLVAALSAVAAAQHPMHHDMQKPMMHKPPMMHKMPMMHHDMGHASMMMGLSAKEKMTAQKMMGRMSKADHMRMMHGQMPMMKMSAGEKMVAMKMMRNMKMGMGKPMMKKPMMMKKHGM